MSLIVLSLIAAIIFIPVALSVFDGIFRFAFDGIAGIMTGDAPFMLLGGLGIIGYLAMQGGFAYGIGQGIDGLLSTILVAI